MVFYLLIKRAESSEDPIKEHLVITRYNPRRVEEGDMLSIKDIEDILRIKLIGVIPESDDVIQASNTGSPVIHLKESNVAQAYEDIVDRYLGSDKPMRFTTHEKAGLLKRIFGGK
ncbi:septum site-determining protein MinD [Oligella ureolytica]